jgi:hypothetical protein
MEVPSMDDFSFAKYFGEGMEEDDIYTLDKEGEGKVFVSVFRPDQIVGFEISARHPGTGSTFDGSITLRVERNIALLAGSWNGEIVRYQWTWEIRENRLLADFHHDIHLFIERSATDPAQTDLSYLRRRTSLIPTVDDDFWTISPEKE